MENITLEKTKELIRAKKELESKLNVKLIIKGKRVEINGNSLDEYEASMVVEAIGFGFPADVALLVKEEDFMFRKIHIKDFTRRKNLEEVRSRIIGTHGKTKKTIEQISDTNIIIKDNEIGIIGNTESIEYAITAITNIIKGSKQSNAYGYLEKINRSKKDTGLGLKK